MLMNQTVYFLNDAEPVYNPKTHKNEYTYNPVEWTVNATTNTSLRELREMGISEPQLVTLRSFQAFPPFRDVAIDGVIYTRLGHQDVHHTVSQQHSVNLIATDKTYTYVGGVFILNESKLDSQDVMG
jgi:hypothetical protein